MNQEENNDKKNDDAYEFERSLINDRELFGLDDMPLYAHYPGYSDNKSGNTGFYRKNFYYSRQNPLVNDNDDVDDGYVSPCNESCDKLNSHYSEEISRTDKCVEGFETDGAYNEINTEREPRIPIRTTSLQYNDHNDDVIIEETCPETSRISLIPLNVEIYKRNYALRKMFELMENTKNSDSNKQKPLVKRTYNEAIQKNGNYVLLTTKNEEILNNNRHFLEGYKKKSNLKGFSMKRTLKRIDYLETYENRIEKEKVSIPQ